MTAPAIRDYEEQVYAGVLGKVIGVYMGRPFEGWSKQALETRFGRVDRYVHEDLGKPLVVPDDDISGTLTFVRALEDSGLYADTPAEFFGDTWLNYLIEGKTVLWWGGMGHSTEHTAFLRLKHGMKAPHSGSIETNGATVAEQIGAQIFIDAFGMVAPGNPELAARIARKAASVSHDGEAVHAAAVVAAMVSAAFIEKDMDRLLDIGASVIPADSLIAQVHRDVRARARETGDWRKTFDFIDEKYGYRIYGGNCHVIPNHAIMVMAWCHAPDDFYESQVIINTAGWDTDCNAANVGSVMGVKVGLDRICERYDFRSPMGDRIILPTADGTRCVTDCLTEALHIARMGRATMGWEPAPAPKGGALFHFSLPGAFQGFLAEESTLETRDACLTANAPLPSTPGVRALAVHFRTGPGRTARVSAPVFPPSQSGGYGIVGTPRLYPGMTLRADIEAGEILGEARARLFVRVATKDGPPTVLNGPLVRIESRGRAAAEFAIPDTGGMPIVDFGLEIPKGEETAGTLFIDRITVSGAPALAWPELLPQVGHAVPGWILHADVVRGPFSDDPIPVLHVGKNEGRGFLVTGTTDWKDCGFESDVKVHMADRAGILVRYRGLERYIALLRRGNSLQLVLRNYGETVLGETAVDWPLDRLRRLRLECRGASVRAFLDGKEILQAQDTVLGSGGVGFVFETGILGMRNTVIGN